jgi:hypothetical protein
MAEWQNPVPAKAGEVPAMQVAAQLYAPSAQQQAVAAIPAAVVVALHAPAAPSPYGEACGCGSLRCVGVVHSVFEGINLGLVAIMSDLPGAV